MRKTFSIVIIIFSFLYSSGQKDTIQVKSKIKKATVFLKGAQITRTGRVQVKKGTTNLKFTDLCPEITANSIQIKSDQDITILGVVHQRNYMEAPKKNNEITKLEKEKYELEEKIKFEQSMLIVYKEEEKLILANKSISSEQQGVNVEELRKTADFYRERLTEIKMKQLEINRKIKKYNDEKNIITRQLNELNVKRNNSTGEIILTISSDKAQTVDIIIDYIVNDAGWTPKYDLRAIDVSHPINLIYKADVYQNTGYDWDNIDLTLSTGEPFKSGTKPDLETWRLYYVSRYSDYNSSKHSGSSAAHIFNIDVKYSIPSDGKAHTVEVIQYLVNSTFKYSSVPKLEPVAFLIAQITEWEQYHLLNGEVNLFFEGTFVGKSNLNVRVPEDTINVSLGSDKNIIIKREKIKDFTEQQIIGTKKLETYTYEIKIRNNKNEKINLTIEDQIPVSSDKQIDIAITEISNAKYDEISGSLVWDIELKPSETRTLKIQYSVKYPKDKIIPNLE